MKGNLVRGLSLLGIIVVFGHALLERAGRAAALSPPFRVSPPASDASDASDVSRGELASRYEDLVADTQFASAGATPSVHCASAVEISGGRLYAVWYGGSREGAKDVAIWSALYDPASRKWSKERKVTTREETGFDEGRYIKKLGNVVLARSGDRRLWLFYVSVSIGGWSGSAVNLRISSDEGQSWGPARRLVTSPFLNVSTLVKGPAIFFADGSLGLPVYHELVGKFGELVRISSDGNVLEKMRLSRGRTSLQPVVVPFTPLDAVAFLRRSGSSPARVLSVSTHDAARSWTSLEPTALPNPDSAVFAERTPDGTLLMAFNDSENDRGNLTLAVSLDRGRSFRVLRVLQPPEPPGPGEGGAPARFAYPWLVRSSNGDLHLLYTWNRRRIVHVRLHRREPTAP